ncbi:hypothetical protein MPTK1_6g13670 [Marchantia polymorpha subsp. ruderalis]|uniref:RCK C-terminal domain-containing protein n=1 Tax=Marchantia polymorpha subsp. ruderalis TaxID=1480154 RepID=A0AAF6BRQ4_MARPO|nr:hypothetical protein Mp_6g13670 [Marchantia polymorpha subsp. ruderalis]
MARIHCARINWIYVDCAGGGTRASLSGYDGNPGHFLSSFDSRRRCCVAWIRGRGHAVRGSSFRCIEQSGGLEYVASVLFRTPDKTKELLPGFRPSKTKGSIVWVLLKFSVPVAIFSAFLANIPLVAMMIPPIVEFGKKVNLPPSKMLMPLSYAAQLGGTMTLIGASTNLVVLSMAAQKLPDMKMNLFEIGIIGVPVTIAGIFYILAFSGKLLPDRMAQQASNLNAREYNVVLVMKPNSSLARKTIEKCGLNRLPGLTLLSVDRAGTETKLPGPDFVLQPEDRLHFVGVIDSVLLLVQLHGLALTEDEGQGQVDLNRLKTSQCLVEAVVASESPMVHKRIADLQFREQHKASIVAIHRYGTRLSSAIGDIKVEAGDCLLMVADGPEFVSKHRNNSAFALVAQLPGFKPLNRKKAGIAAVLVLFLVVASGLGMKLITAALFSSAGLLMTKCLTPRDAMESIELPVLIMIAAAFGIAEGMVESGAATILAKGLMGLAGTSLFGLVVCTYVATTFFSLAITNSAAVTIMFPVALAAANHQKLDFRPFAYILMMAASAGFMTPTGCPTNLMVYTPGGYKFSDFLKYGGPMQILLLLVTVGITMTAKYWWIWWLLITLITLISTPLIARHKSTKPKPLIAPTTPDVKPTAPDTDAENPKAPLNPGTADSSKDVLRSIPPLTDGKTSSTPASSNPIAGLAPASLPGASAPYTKNGQEDLSRRMSGSSLVSSPLLSSSSPELHFAIPGSQELPLGNTASISSSSSTSTSFPNLTSFNGPATITVNLTEPISKPALPKSTEQGSPWRPTIIGTSNLSTQKQPPSSLDKTSLSSTIRSETPPWKPLTLSAEGESHTKPSMSVSEMGSTKPEVPTDQKTPSLVSVSELAPSTPEKPSSKTTNKPTETTPGPSYPSPILSTTRPGIMLNRTASLPVRMSPSPSPVSTTFLSPPVKPNASTVEIKHSPATTPVPDSGTLSLSIQELPTRAPVSVLIPGAPTARHTSILPQNPPLSTFGALSISSIPEPDAATAKRPSLSPPEPPPSPSPVALPVPNVPRPGAAAATRPSLSPQEPPPSPSPVALPIPNVPGPAAAKLPSLQPQEPPSLPVPVALPIPSIPGTAAAKRPSLPIQEPPSLPVPVALPIPSIPGPGAAAAKRPSLPTQEPPLPVPVTLPIPSIPGPGAAAAKRPSLPTQEPPLPVPVTLPIPTIPGPGTAAAKRPSLPPQEPPSLPVPVSLPIPTIPGPGTAAAKRPSLPPQEPPSLPVPMALPIPTIPGPGAAAKRPSLPPQEPPSLPVPVALPIPIIPGPAAAAAKRPSLPPQGPPSLPVPVALPIPSIPGPGAATAKRPSLPPQETPLPVPVGLPSPSIPGPETAASKRPSLPPQETPSLPVPVALPSTSIPGPEAAAAKRPSLPPQEPPSLPVPVALPTPSIPGPGTAVVRRPSLITPDQTTTVEVATALNRFSKTGSLGDISKPIVMRTYVPKRPSDAPLPTSADLNRKSMNGGIISAANRQSIDNVRAEWRRSVTQRSESSKPLPLFFTSSTASNQTKGLTSQPWTTPVQPLPTHSPSQGDANMRRSSKFLEEDLTGGISSLMNSRKLSSIRDTDAFADRWQSTTT